MKTKDMNETSTSSQFSKVTGISKQTDSYNMSLKANKDAEILPVELNFLRPHPNYLGQVLI